MSVRLARFRRRRRKVRSRSNYILKQVSESNQEECKPSTDCQSHNDRTPMLRRERPGHECATLPRTVGTWQSTRPLPLPRPTSDSGIDQDGTTLSPDSPSPVFMTFRPDFQADRNCLQIPGIPTNYAVSSDCNPVCPLEAPYYFKLDPGVSAQALNHPLCRPDVVNTCSLCRANASSYT